MHDHGSDLREHRLEMIEDPAGQVLAGWVSETIDFVQIIVVQPLHERLGGAFDVAIIDQVALLWIDFALYDDIESEGVAMEPAALVAGGEGGKIVGRLKMKLLDQPNFHRGLGDSR